MILNYWTLKRKLNSYNEFKKIKQEDSAIEYGIIHGSSTIVFIKVGFKGSIYGYDFKYVKSAKQLSKNYGCTVIVASNPNGYDDDFSSEMELVKEYASLHKLEDFQVYYMGHSNGASLGMIHGYKYPFIKKMLLINGPLFRDPDKIFKGIEEFSGEKIIIIYGKKDPTITQAMIMKEMESEKIHFIFLDDVDHNFAGYVTKFVNLPDIYFFQE